MEYLRLKSLKSSFSFISLAVLLGVTTVVAVAEAQESATSTEEAAVIPAAEETALDTTEATSTATDRGLRPVAERAAENRPDRPTSGPTSLTEAQQARVTNLAANISNRLDATVARLENISTRIESRIAILEGNGQDQSSAKETLAAASNALANATESLALIDTQVTAVATSNEPRAAWVGLKAQYADVQNQLRAAFNAQKNTMQLIKNNASPAEVTPNQ